MFVMTGLDNTHPDTHLDLYKYLAVLTEAQIVKLRNIALGISSPSSFTKTEIQDLERNLTRTLDSKKQ